MSHLVVAKQKAQKINPEKHDVVSSKQKVYILKHSRVKANLNLKSKINKILSPGSRIKSYRFLSSVNYHTFC
jgi:hypothetical protein